MTSLRKLKTIAAAAGACAAVLASGSAHAYAYALSHLKIEKFSIFIGEVMDIGGGVYVPIAPAPSAAVTSFTFNLANTAALNGPLVGNAAACGGTPLVNNCGASPVLNAAPANVGAPARINENYSFLGNTGTSYSGSDSVVYTSEITSGFATPSSTEQIAETLLSSSGFGQANAEIQSNTTLSWTFSVTAPINAFMLSFTADPDMLAELAGIPGILAQSNMNASITLRQANTSNEVRWAPEGSAGNDCAVSGAGFIGLGVTCSETADSEDLNINQTVGVNPDADPHSFEVANNQTGFGIIAFNLPSGTYTIALNSVVSTSVFAEVPEPGSLALLGLALSGLGLSASRRRKTS